MHKRYVTDIKKLNKYEKDYDVIICGSGISGILCALNIDEEKSVLVITKRDLVVTNSDLAQGGIAVSIKTNCDLHIEDTLSAGCRFNDLKTVSFVIKNSKSVVKKLLDYGTNFDRDEDENLIFTKEGGHSERRILHFKDKTGQEIMRSLIEETLKRKNITIMENAFVNDVITNNKRASGVVVTKGDKFIIGGEHIVIATGGIGELYNDTTNVMSCTGDGIAMALRAGALVEDMEFVQFHPTALRVPAQRSFLISEAVRGEGGILLNSDGIRFMNDKHELRELAPRDIVSREIFNQNLKGQEVFLDVRHLDHEYLISRFPKIYTTCLEYGIDITKDLIPIKSIQHYFMGGIKVNKHGETNLKSFYAIGEVSRTGLHGANRLASNSLLEGAVYGISCAEKINENIKSSGADIKFCESISHKDKNETTKENKAKLNVKSIKEEIKSTMSKSCFVVRNTAQLKIAHNKVKVICDELSSRDLFTTEEVEVANMAIVAREILISAIRRQRSIGTHYIAN